MVGLTSYRLSPAQWSPQYKVFQPSESGTCSHTTAAAMRGRHLWQNTACKCCRSRHVRTQRQPILDVNREKLNLFLKSIGSPTLKQLKLDTSGVGLKNVRLKRTPTRRYQASQYQSPGLGPLKNEHTFRGRRAKVVLYVFGRPSNTCSVFLVKNRMCKYSKTTITPEQW